MDQKFYVIVSVLFLFLIGKPALAESVDDILAQIRAKPSLISDYNFLTKAKLKILIRAYATSTNQEGIDHVLQNLPVYMPGRYFAELTTDPEVGEQVHRYMARHGAAFAGNHFAHRPLADQVIAYTTHAAIRIKFAKTPEEQSNNIEVRRRALRAMRTLSALRISVSSTLSVFIAALNSSDKDLQIIALKGVYLELSSLYRRDTDSAFLNMKIFLRSWEIFQSNENGGQSNMARLLSLRITNRLLMHPEISKGHAPYKANIEAIAKAFLEHTLRMLGSKNLSPKELASFVALLVPENDMQRLSLYTKERIELVRRNLLVLAAHDNVEVRLAAQIELVHLRASGNLFGARASEVTALLKTSYEKAPAQPQLELDRALNRYEKSNFVNEIRPNPSACGQSHSVFQRLFGNVKKSTRFFSWLLTF